MSIEGRWSRTASAVRRIPGRVGAAIVEKEYRPLFHAAAIAAIAAIALFLFYRHFASPGTIIYGDMTFPPTLERNFEIYTQTWWQYGSNTNFYNFQRLLWAAPFLGFAWLFGLSNSQFLLTMFYLTFLLAGVSAYALTFTVIKEMRFSSTKRYPIYAGCTLAAVVYMYNPWSLGHFWTYFMYPVYALLPLILLVTKRVFDAPSPRRVIVLVLLLSLGSTMPNTVIWMWLLVASYGLFHLLVQRFRWKRVKQAILTVLASMGLFVVVNALWTIPYLTAQAMGKAPVPWYMPGTPAGYQKLGLNIISETCSISNNLRLVSGWGMPVQPMEDSFWIVLSFVLPVAVILSLVLMRKQVRRNGTAMFLAAFSTIMILLATGTSFILERPYSYAVLRAPGSYSLGWIFRAPDRWLVFVPMFFALAVGMLMTKLLGDQPGVKLFGDLTGSGARPPASDPSGAAGAQDAAGAEDAAGAQNAELRMRLQRLEGSVLAQRKMRSVAAGILVAVLLVLSMLPSAARYAREVYAPTVIPEDYQEVSEYVSRSEGRGGLAWIPSFFVGWHYEWASPKFLVGPYSIYSSPPSINNLMGAFGYYNWMKDTLIGDVFHPVRVNVEGVRQKDLATRILIPFASRYAIVDGSVQSGDPLKPTEQTGENFGEDESLTLKYETDFLKVYETRDSPQKIRVVDKAIKVDSFFDNLSVTETVPLGDAVNLAFINGPGVVGGEFGGLDMRAYKVPLGIEGGFEAPNSIEGYLPFWSQLTPETGAVVSLDGAGKNGGGRSLKVVNESSEPYDIAWIGGLEVPAREGRIYSVETRVKYRNADWTHVLVEGYRESEDQWVRLVLCPNVLSGTSGWQKWQCSFVMPQGITAIRPRLAAGWVKDTSKGPAVSWFDDVKISELNDSFYAELARKDPVPEITYEKLSPAKYKVTVKDAKKPFVLAFGEAFDSLWTVRLPDGQSVEPVQLYSLINGFPISRTGTYDITIEYPPQSWFHLGLLISLLAILGCLAGLAWQEVKSRARGAKTPADDAYVPRYTVSAREDLAGRFMTRVRDHLGLYQPAGSRRGGAKTPADDAGVPRYTVSAREDLVGRFMVRVRDHLGLHQKTGFPGRKRKRG